MDPEGLYSFDEGLVDASNLSAGFGDTISFGLTNWIRDLWNRDVWGGDGVVDKCSGLYKGGEVASEVWGLAFGAGSAKIALSSVKTTSSVIREVVLRKKLGADGAISRHIIEKLSGETISVTHQVYKNGKIIHQHQVHIGKYRTSRRFADSLTRTKTID